MNKSKSFDLSIVIVTYNSSQVIKRCLSAMYSRADELRLDFIVVDNNSDDDTIKLIESNFPFVRLTRNTKNLGFAKAVNQGVDLALASTVLILNPDAEIVAGSLADMIAFLDRQNAAVVGPKLLNSDNSLQFSQRRFPTPFRQVVQAFIPEKLLDRKSFFPEKVRDFKAYQKCIEADWLCGAVWLVNQALFKRYKFDERFFLFLEEVDFCKRIRADGYKVLYFSETVFMHISTHGRTNEQIYAQLFFSRMQYCKKNFSTMGSFIAQSAVIIGLIFRFFWYSAQKSILAKQYKEALFWAVRSFKRSTKAPLLINKKSS